MMRDADSHPSSSTRSSSTTENHSYSGTDAAMRANSRVGIFNKRQRTVQHRTLDTVHVLASPREPPAKWVGLRSDP